MALVRSRTALRRAFPSLDLCERPSKAPSMDWAVQPGCLAQGPDAKFGLAGRLAGLGGGVMRPSLATAALVGKGVRPRLFQRAQPEARMPRALRRASGAITGC